MSSTGPDTPASTCSAITSAPTREAAAAAPTATVIGTMNRRQGLQLKLQSTVEGLSVAAITYYIVGLVSYLAKGASALGWPWSAESTAAVAIPLVALAVWGSLNLVFVSGDLFTLYVALELLTFSGVASNFAGVPLAFALHAELAARGVLPATPAPRSVPALLEALRAPSGTVSATSATTSNIEESIP